MNYYISDLHLGHYNIIRLCNRPFNTADEMDETIINNWNNVVRDEDDVYILGDFCFRNAHPAEYYLKQLNGKKHLIFGNHDMKIRGNMVRGKYPGLESAKNYDEIIDGTTKLILFHYPIVEWDGFFKNTVHLYGHTHNNVKNAAYRLMKDVPNAYNVGADILGFTPRTLTQVIECNRKFEADNPLS